MIRRRDGGPSTFWGHDPDFRLLRFEFGDDLVCGVGFGAAASFADLPEVLPGETGLCFEHGATEGLFDNDAVFCLTAIVEAARRRDKWGGRNRRDTPAPVMKRTRLDWAKRSATCWMGLSGMCEQGDNVSWEICQSEKCWQRREGCRPETVDQRAEESGILGVSRSVRFANRPSGQDLQPTVSGLQSWPGSSGPSRIHSKCDKDRSYPFCGRLQTHPA